ncbi:hypothetical protein ARMGADRAFT_1035513 [Armillaria gallica]|uniref:Uncharacterized protein n=1 Tax=Armillaria gallica TaxID=47427 RepID=A0A2H3CXV7_ARMGA|nr:hypothetical protein ARMGADRAFT_1035513 [Armillaria gallica]
MWRHWLEILGWGDLTYTSIPVQLCPSGFDISGMGYARIRLNGIGKLVYSRARKTATPTVTSLKPPSLSPSVNATYGCPMRDVVFELVVLEMGKDGGRVCGRGNAQAQLHPHESPTVTKNKSPRYQNGAPRLHAEVHTCMDRAPIQRIHRPFSTYPCCTKSQPSRRQRASLPLMAMPSQGNRIVHVLLMEHIDGKDFHILVPVQKAKGICPAHILAMALNLNLGAIPRNVIVRNPRRRLRGGRLAGYRAKVVNKQQRRYLKRWLEKLRVNNGGNRPGWPTIVLHKNPRVLKDNPPRSTSVNTIFSSMYRVAPSCPAVAAEKWQHIIP